MSMKTILIDVEIETRTSLHVGSGNSSEATDALVRRNAQGALLIPGSAIAGPLRSLLTRLAPRLGSKPCMALGTIQGQSPCSCWVCELFGDVNPQPGNVTGGVASRLWVADAFPFSTTAIRDGVGIDRVSRTAARQGAVKFDLEVLPAGAKFVVNLKLQPASTPEIQTRNEALLALALAEWQAGRGSLGGRVARGLGAFQVTKIDWHERDLNDRTALMTFLKRSDQKAYATTKRSAATQLERIQAVKENYSIHAAPTEDRKNNLTAYAVARNWVEATLTLQFDGPMLINDDTQARRSGFDHAPLAALISPASGWVLPGSSLRGVLRSQAERIARTIVTYQAKHQSEPTHYFLNHNPAGDPNVRAAEATLANSDSLLSAAGYTDEPDKSTKPSQLDLADQLFGSVRLGSRLMVEDGILSNQPMLKPFDFLAIDRFTGGGRDSAKFDAVALWRPAFRVRLRLENAAAWELGWLLLTLRDLHEGWATIGFGAAKGFGATKISQWEASLGYLHDDDFPVSEKLDKNLYLLHTKNQDDAIWQVLSVTAHDDTALWHVLANDWVSTFNTVVDKFERVQNSDCHVPPLKKDSYFGEGKLTELYPVEVKADEAIN